MTTKTKAPRTNHTTEELGRLSDWYDDHDAILDGETGEDVDVDVAPDPTAVRSVRLRLSTLERLSAAAESRGVGITELIRAWLEERLDAEDKPATRNAKFDVLRALVERLPRDLGLADVVSISVREARTSGSTGRATSRQRAVPPAAKKASPARTKRTVPTKAAAKASPSKRGMPTTKKAAAKTSGTVRGAKRTGKSGSAGRRRT